MFEICHCHYCSVDAHAQNICSILDYEVDLCCPVSSLGANPFTVLFSQVVESWNKTNTRNLWLGTPEPLSETGVSTKEKPRKMYTLTN